MTRSSKREVRAARPAMHVPLAADADPVYLNGPWGRVPPYRPLGDRERAALESMYARVEDALAPAADACRACGRCCHFQPGGIVLFASAVELKYLWAEAGPAKACLSSPSPSTGEGGSEGEGSPRGPRPLTLTLSRKGRGTSSTAAPWRCPHQRENVCGARGARLLGCRTYFCHGPARKQGERLYAEALPELQRIAAAAGDAWWYGPARVGLEAWASENR